MIIRALRASAALALVAACAACSSTPDEATSESESDLDVAGITLTAAQAKWVTHVEQEVVARLPGTAAERARHAAIVTWWAMKEGVLDVQPSPYRHNLCTQSGKDVRLGDLDVCYGPAWQVGLSGIQLPNVTDAQVTTMAQTIYPGVATTTLLGQIAQAAGIDPTSSTGKSIAASTGRLRSAWLLRDPAIGIALQWPFADDCAAGGPSWCYGTWPEAQAYASSLTRIQQVIGALEKRFLAAANGLAASPAGGSTADLCAGANLGNGAYCAMYFDPKADPKLLLQCSGSTTVKTTTCASGCQRMPDGQNDVCAAAAGASGSLSPERAAMMDRAQQWVNAQMPYCGATPGGWDGICGVTCTGRARRSDWDRYRSDCSGYVSWVWQLAYQDGHRTWGFAPFNQEGAAFSEVIPATSLQPGDALNSATKDIYTQHIILFAGWVDKANGIVKTLEEANCSADLVVRNDRKMVVNGDGTVSLEGRAFWPIRKLGVN